MAQKWRLSFSPLTSSGQPDIVAESSLFTFIKSSKKTDQVEPVGFSSSAYTSVKQQADSHKTKDSASDATNTLKLKKAWEAALAPGKSIPMNGFMLWMSGNSVQIFSILITVMLLFNSVKAMMGVQQVFERFQLAVSSKSKKTSAGLADKTWLGSLLADPLLMPKLAFIALQGANLLLGIWKCNGMGLLPTTESDWLGFQQSKPVAQVILE